MPSFAHPAFLWLLPLAPLAFAWWLRRRRPAFRYPDVRLFDGLPAGRARRVRWLTALLRTGALLGLILACAGPRRPDLRTRLPAEGIALMMVLDVSGSMAEPIGPPAPGLLPPTRLDAAKQSLRLFVAGGDAPDGTHFDGRESDAVGLVTFAVLPQTVCPITLNHSVLLRVLDEQRPKDGVDAGTNIGDAIAEGLLRLEKAPAKRKVLVLLSDGEHNVALEGDRKTFLPRQAARIAANLPTPIPIYTIDAAGDPPPGATDEEAKQRLEGQAVLRDVATLTGGQAFAAGSAADLLAAYRQIDLLEREPVESFQYRRYVEYYPWCAAAALACLLAGRLLDLTAWRRVP
jgi:Ca-activated chloride channel family protein